MSEEQSDQVSGEHPAADETVVVNHDETVVVNLDETVVVNVDETVVVNLDQTVVVNHDETLVVPTGSGRRSGAQHTTTGGSGPADAGDSRSSGGSGGSGAGAGDVPDLVPGIHPAMFKKPLDSKHPVTESPWEQTERSMPKRGVNQSMPVLYPIHNEQALPAFDPLADDLEARLGPPPAWRATDHVDRSALPSVALQARRFRRRTLVSLAAISVVSIAGLWWITSFVLGGGLG